MSTSQLNISHNLVSFLSELFLFSHTIQRATLAWAMLAKVIALYIVSCAGALGEFDYLRQPSGEAYQSDWPQKGLYLTPYIRRQQYDSAKSLATVGPLSGENVVSYAGFLTVNQRTWSNLFFWFFPAQVSSNIGEYWTMLFLQSKSCMHYGTFPIEDTKGGADDSLARGRPRRRTDVRCV